MVAVKLRDVIDGKAPYVSANGIVQLAKIKENSKSGTLTVAIIEALLSTDHPAAVQVVLKQATETGLPTLITEWRWRRVAGIW